MPDNPADFLILGLIWYIVFLFSTTCHEGAHALVAKMGGDPTAFSGGQVSLNPWPHIRRSPFGLVVVPIISYFTMQWMIGWASAPYDPAWQERYPRRAAWMALAGPGANFALVILASIAIRAGIALGYFQVPYTMNFTHIVTPLNAGTAGFFATFFSILFVLNLLLATFNLLPVPPLDGNTVVTLLMPENAGRQFLNWSRTGGFALIGLVIAWYAFGQIFRYVFHFGLMLLYAGTAPVG